MFIAKQPFLLFLFFLSSVAGLTSADQQNSLEEALLGSWNFDEAQNGSFIDSSGNGNDGTWSDGAVCTNGIKDNALLFSSEKKSFAVLNTIPAFPENTLSVEMLFQADIPQNNAHLICAMTGTAGFRILIDKNNKIQWQVPNPEKPWSDICTSTVPLSAGTWVHLIATYDGKALVVFINGQETGRLAVENHNVTIPGKMYFGAFNSGAGYFSGRVDEVNLYSRALRQTEIEKKWNSLKSSILKNSGKMASESVSAAKKNGLEDKLVGSWNFDEAQDGSFIDGSGNGNDGTWSDGAVCTNGIKENALLFSSEKKSFAVLNTIPAFPENALSVEMLFQADIPQNNAHLICAMTGTAGFRILIDKNNKIQWQVPNPGKPWSDICTGTVPVPDGDWVHLIATYDGSALVLYINGQEAGKLAVEKHDFTIPGKMYFGAFNSGAGYFNGRIDEINLYSRALKHAEIERKWNSLKSLILSNSGKKLIINPLGFNYDDYGYDLSSSENLEAQYSFSRQPDTAFSLKYSVSDLKGNTLKEGEIMPCGSNGYTEMNTSVAATNGVEYVQESVTSNVCVTYRIFDKTALHKIKSGWYSLKTSITGKKETFENNFYYSNFSSAVKNTDFYRLCIMADCMDPEGFGKWLVEDLNCAVEIVKKVDLVSRPNAVIINTYKAPDKKQMGNLITYISTGGIVLFCGRVNSAFTEILPVVIEATNCFSTASLRYISAMNKNSLDIPIQKYFFIKNHAKKNAVVLANWETEAPALTQKDNIFYFAGELRKGSLTALVLSELFKKNISYKQISPVPDSRGYHEGIAAASPGRFGWTQIGNADTSLQYLIKDGTLDLRFYCYQNFNNLYLSFSEAGSQTAEPEKIIVTKVNAISKQWNLSGARLGKNTQVISSLASPGALIRPDEEERRIFLTMPQIKYAAWQENDGLKNIQIDAKESILNEMNKNWLLVWPESSEKYFFPVLIVFSAKPQSLTLTPGDTLRLTFDKPITAFTLLPLYGVKLIEKGLAAGWNRVLPDAVIEQCELWSRISLKKAVTCHEAFKINADGKNITIENSYDYLTLSDEWQTKPMTMAPLPPLLMLMKRYNTNFFIQIPEKISDLSFDTYYGPAYGLMDSASVSYSIPVQPLEYPLSLNPDKKMFEDEKNAELKQRMIDEILWANSDKVRAGLIKTKKQTVGAQSWAGWMMHLPKGGFDKDVNALDYTYFSDSYLSMLDHPMIDWYRLLGYYIGTLSCYPYLDPKTDAAARRRIEFIMNNNFNKVANFYSYKTFVRYRIEPYTGFRYLVNFVFPTVFDGGFRFFSDNNEAFGIVSSAFYLNQLMTGQTDCTRQNWEVIKLIAAWPKALNDWAWMSSMAQDRGRANAVDMLNSEYAGWIAYANLAEALNDETEKKIGIYLAAKTAISELARFYIPAYANSIGVPLKTGKKAEHCTGYGEGYFILFTSEEIAKDSQLIRIGLDIYDTSKGIQPELLDLYKRYIPATLIEYESRLQKEIKKINFQPMQTRAAGLSAVLFEKTQLKALDEIINTGLSIWEPSKIGMNCSFHCGYYPILIENRYRLLIKKK